MEKPLVNRVAQSGLMTIDFDQWIGAEETASFDLKDFLFQGWVLKEKDFRLALKAHNWVEYKGKNLAVYCSSDAIIPTWAFMLVSLAAQEFAKRVFLAQPNAIAEQILLAKIADLDVEPYIGQKIVIKGCGKVKFSPAVHVALVQKLKPHASSLMFGEACSTVPLHKKKV